MSLLDLPRPEMVVSVWSAQNSSPDEKVTTATSDAVRNAVWDFDNRLEIAVLNGWSKVSEHAANAVRFYDEAFFKYVSYRYVGNSVEAGPAVDNQSASQHFLEYRDGGSIDDATRDSLGICHARMYCLGYAELFHPLKPRLTDLLLNVIAARDDQAVLVADEALDAMEGVDRAARPSMAERCEETDLTAYEKGAGPYFECFRNAAHLYFRGPQSTSNPTSPLGLLRSAVATFLFQIQDAGEFPHEFSPYDLGQSAQAMNTALAPLVDAFSRDIRAFQAVLSQVLLPGNKYKEAEPKGNWIGTDADRATFRNSSIVTVRTVSGNETVVDRRLRPM